MNLYTVLDAAGTWVVWQNPQLPAQGINEDIIFAAEWDGISPFYSIMWGSIPLIPAQPEQVIDGIDGDKITISATPEMEGGIPFLGWSTLVATQNF